MQQPTAICNVLTEEERQKVIDNAIAEEKKLFVWRMMELQMPDEKIQELAAQKHWEKIIDVEKVVARANELRAWQLDEEEERKARLEVRKAERIEQLKTWTAKVFYATIKRYFCLNSNKGTFIMDGGNERFIKAVCYFLSEDSRFETELNFSFSKGLLVRGASGLGKTKVFEAVKNNPLHPIAIYGMNEIIEQVRHTGFADIYTDRLIMIDDAGTEGEETVKHYGTSITWFKTFIEKYYNKYKNYNHLIVTTNDNEEMIEKKYGYRVRSRMREMFNVITVTGEDKRG